jgi:membrane protein required for colicin V production
MNWLDIVIIVIAGLFAMMGLWKGAIRAAFGIAGLIGGIVLAGRYYQTLALLLSPGGATWAKIAAYAIILIVILIVASVIGWIVAKLVHITLLGWVDRLLGFIFGAAVGCMLCVAALAIVSKYLPGTEGTIAQSTVARFLMQQFPLLLALLPKEFDFIRDLFSASGQIY